MITGRQLCAARGLAGLESAELARLAGVSRNTISSLETGKRTPHDGSLEKLVRAIETNTDVEFTENEGVRIRSSDIEVFQGPHRFEEFTDFLYDYLKRKGGEVCISAVDEGLFSKYRRDPELHRRRMKELVDSGRVSVRILASKSKFTSTYAQYRSQPAYGDVPTSFYAFGNCLALISFAHPPAPYVVLHKSGPFAEAYRQAFDMTWRSAKEPPKSQNKPSARRS